MNLNLIYIIISFSSWDLLFSMKWRCYWWENPLHFWFLRESFWKRRRILFSWVDSFWWWEHHWRFLVWCRLRNWLKGREKCCQRWIWRQRLRLCVWKVMCCWCYLTLVRFWLLLEVFGLRVYVTGVSSIIYWFCFWECRAIYLDNVCQRDEEFGHSIWVSFPCTFWRWRILPIKWISCSRWPLHKRLNRDHNLLRRRDLRLWKNIIGLICVYFWLSWYRLRFLRGWLQWCICLFFDWWRLHTGWIFGRPDGFWGQRG